MKQLMVRKIPERLERELRQRAKSIGCSVNNMAIHLLSESLGIHQPSTFGRKRDLSALAGTWSKKDAAAFTKAVSHLEKIDSEIRR